MLGKGVGRKPETVSCTKIKLMDGSLLTKKSVELLKIIVNCLKNLHAEQPTPVRCLLILYQSVGAFTA